MHGKPRLPTGFGPTGNDTARPYGLITFVGIVFHYERLINSEKRQSHGKFVTLLGDGVSMQCCFGNVFNPLHA